MKEPEKQFDFRNVSIDLIKLLSSESDQLEYEKNVPHVDITVELVCMWFDDFWHPESELMNKNFSPKELAKMKEFNDYYDDRVNSLPESNGTVRTWHANPTWREIMGMAKQTLKQIAEPTDDDKVD